MPDASSAPAVMTGNPPLPEAPRLPGAARLALTDFYYNSWRLVPANLAWGALLLVILVAAAVWSPLALAALPLLAVPNVGMARLAALIVRSEVVGLGDVVAAWHAYLVVALVLGIALSAGSGVLMFNVWYAVVDGGIPAIAIGTLSAWGLVALAMFGVAAWPLVVDPRRADRRAPDRVRLAALLVLAHPERLLVLAVVIVVLLAVSTAAFAALLSVSVAYANLVAARYVLPAADRLEARLAERAR